MTNQVAETDESLDEGDHAVLRVKVYRANSEQALIEIRSTDGPFSLRVPVSELLRVYRPGQSS